MDELDTLLQEISQYKAGGAAFFERVREVMGDGASRHCLENLPRNMRELLNPDIYLVRQRLL